MRSPLLNPTTRVRLRCLRIGALRDLHDARFRSTECAYRHPSTLAKQRLASSRETYKGLAVFRGQLCSPSGSCGSGGIRRMPPSHP